MFIASKHPKTKNKNYSLLLSQAQSLIEKESDMIANLSNISALLNDFFTEINWVGFYLLKENELVLGPFQGKPACTRIQIGKGVCGTAVKENKTQIVHNVHEFIGHIACDSNSNSEIVVCLHFNDQVIGVIDIDSPLYSRFDEEDAEALEQLSNLLSKIFKESSL